MDAGLKWVKPFVVRLSWSISVGRNQGLNYVEFWKAWNKWEHRHKIGSRGFLYLGDRNQESEFCNFGKFSFAIVISNFPKN